MNPVEQVQARLQGFYRKLRAATVARGAAVTGAGAFLATVGLALFIRHYDSSPAAIALARVLLFDAIALSLAFGLFIPLLKLDRRRAANRIERDIPSLDERLITVSDADSADPFVQIVARETLEILDRSGAPEAARMPVAAFVTAAFVSVTALVWILVLSRGPLADAARTLWTRHENVVANASPSPATKPVTAPEPKAESAPPVPDNPPTVQIVRPGRDAKASPIEEVTVSADAEDDHAITALLLHYSVNGGAEKVLRLAAGAGRKTATGAATIALEDLKLSPGDVIAVYASARDARARAVTPITFIQVEPFEKRYAQSQQGGGGSGAAPQSDGEISERQKEIIAATWNNLRELNGRTGEQAETAAFLSEVQSKLRDQAQALASRMQNRDLVNAQRGFEKFSEEMTRAADQMGAAAGHLKRKAWNQALEPEQKALGHLLRAEAMFRDIQVAFGSRSRSGSGQSGAARDLESLFNLELDTQKNQYESGTQGEAEARDRKLDEAFEKLSELARRQQDASQQPRKQSAYQQRWEQEKLRREAEELRRQLQDMNRGSTSAGDPRLREAIDRIGRAIEAMRRESGRASAGTKSAAQQLADARRALEAMRQAETNQQMDELMRSAEQLASAQKDFANRLQRTYASGGQPLQTRKPGEAPMLAGEQERILDQLQALERQLQSAVEQLSRSQPLASAEAREALSNLQQQEIRVRMRATADMIRRGYGPFAVMRQYPVTQGLDQLLGRLRSAQAMLGQNASAAAAGAHQGPQIRSEVREKIPQEYERAVSDYFRNLAAGSAQAR